MRGGLFVIVCAGCATPASQITDPSQDLLALSDDGGHVLVQVTGDNAYQLDFGAGMIHMPASLAYGNRELLGMEGESGSATAPSRVGIQLFPVAVYNAGTDTGQMLTSQAEVTLNGPAVARVIVNWSADYLCANGGAGTQTASGRSFFTMFPNGRIARHDLDTVASATPISEANFPCGVSSADTGPGNNFYFDSYWTFASANGDGTAAYFGDRSPGSGEICTHYEDVDIAMRYSGAAADGSGTIGLQTSGGSSDPNTIGYVWQLGSTLSSMKYNATTDLRLRPASESCADALAALANPDLVFSESEGNGGDHTAAIREEDGMYEYGVSHGGTITMAATGGTIGSGWAVSFQENGFDHAEFTHGDGTPLEPEQVIVEPDGGEGRTVIWFRDALASGDKIEIQPK